MSKRAGINFHLTKFWRDGAFWISLVIAVVILIVYNNPLSLINPINISNENAATINDISTYLTGSDPAVNDIATDWLTDKNKCLVLLYPDVTECGLGIIQYDNKTYATFIIRKSEVSPWNRRYIEGIVYYFKYYPKGTDNIITDWNTYKPNQMIEGQILQSINGLRETRKYTVISANKELTNKARLHSASMALQNKIFTYDVNSPYYMVLLVK